MYCQCTTMFPLMFRSLLLELLCENTYSSPFSSHLFPLTAGFSSFFLQLIQLLKQSERRFWHTSANFDNNRVQNCLLNTPLHSPPHKTPIVAVPLNWSPQTELRCWNSKNKSPHLRTSIAVRLHLGIPFPFTVWPVSIKINSAILIYNS